MKRPVPDTVEWFDRSHLRDGDNKDGDEDVQSGPLARHDAAAELRQEATGPQVWL